MNVHLRLALRRARSRATLAEVGGVAAACGMAWVVGTTGGGDASALTFRVSTALAGWLGLATYGAIVRAEDRNLLALLPLDEAAVVRAAVVTAAREQLALIAAAMVAVAAVPDPGERVRALGVIASATAMGLTVSSAVHLGAVRLARDPRAAALLDLVRGQNPRAQAAFLYAPGVALAVGGLALAGASTAVGQPSVALVVPIALAGVAAWALGPLSLGAWYEASVVLGEIDARLARLADPLETRRVALDWAVRFLPPSWRPYALRDLRDGWRARRSVITGAYVLGLLAVAVGVSQPEWGRVATMAGALWVAGVATAMTTSELPFLRATLPRRDGVEWAARVAVVGAWCQPAVLLPGVLLGAPAALAGEAAVSAGLLFSAIARRAPWRGAYMGWAAVSLALLTWGFA